MSMEMFLMRSRNLDCVPCTCRCRSKIDDLGDVVVHAIVVVEDRRGNALPIHHKTRAKMSGRKRRTYTNVP